MAESDDVYCFAREIADRGDKRLMSVTGVIRRAGLARFHISRGRLAELAESGRLVHMVAQDIARGEPDYWSQHEWLVPYATGFKRFMEDFDFRPELVEQKIESKRYGYRGRIDQFGTIRHTRTSRSMTLIELKRSATPSKWHLLQTAAYAAALSEELGSRWLGIGILRYAVYLKPDGTYKAQQHKDQLDFSYFTAALTIARLREEWKLVNDRDETDFDKLILGEIGAENEVRL